MIIYDNLKFCTNDYELAPSDVALMRTFLTTACVCTLCCAMPVGFEPSRSSDRTPLCATHDLITIVVFQNESWVRMNLSCEQLYGESGFLIWCPYVAFFYPASSI